MLWMRIFFPEPLFLEMKFITSYMYTTLETKTRPIYVHDVGLFS